MRIAQATADRLSIGLSMACAIHCLVTPVLLAFLPSIAALQLNTELFHLWMVIVVIPVSVYALTLGCKRHKRYRVLASGIVGIALLVSAIALYEHVGELGEKLLTVLGACFVAIGHLSNYRLCQKLRAS